MLKYSLPHHTILLITGVYLTFRHLAGVEDFEFMKNKNMLLYDNNESDR